MHTVYLITYIGIIGIISSPILAQDGDTDELEDDSGPDLWDLTPILSTQPPGHIINAVRKKVRGRVMAKTLADKETKVITLGVEPGNSFSILKVSQENINEKLVYGMSEAHRKMAICSSLDSFTCGPKDSSPGLKFSVFNSERIDQEWSCKDWNTKDKFSIGGQNISVELTGSWDEDSKAIISILPYYQTTDNCPKNLSFDCDACKNPNSKSINHCASQGHLESFRCHSSKPKIEGRRAKSNSNKKGDKGKPAPSNGSNDKFALIGIIILKLIITGTIFGLNFLKNRHPRRVSPASS